jgi:hypothetical protein
MQHHVIHNIQENRISKLGFYIILKIIIIKVLSIDKRNTYILKEKWEGILFFILIRKRR